MKSAPAARASGTIVLRSPMSHNAITSRRNSATSISGAAGTAEIEGRLRAASTSTMAINSSTTIPSTTFIRG